MIRPLEMLNSVHLSRLNFVYKQIFTRLLFSFFLFTPFALYSDASLEKKPSASELNEMSSKELILSEKVAYRIDKRVIFFSELTQYLSHAMILECLSESAFLTSFFKKGELQSRLEYLDLSLHTSFLDRFSEFLLALFYANRFSYTFDRTSVLEFINASECYESHESYSSYPRAFREIIHAELYYLNRIASRDTSQHFFRRVSDEQVAQFKSLINEVKGQIDRGHYYERN